MTNFTEKQIDLLARLTVHLLGFEGIAPELKEWMEFNTEFNNDSEQEILELLQALDAQGDEEWVATVIDELFGDKAG